MKWIGAIALWLVGRLVIGGLCLAGYGALTYGATAAHCLVVEAMAYPVIRVIAICFITGCAACKVLSQKSEGHIFYTPRGPK